MSMRDYERRLRADGVDPDEIEQRTDALADEQQQRRRDDDLAERWAHAERMTTGIHPTMAAALMPHLVGVPRR